MTAVRLQYWPVLARAQNADGKLKRGGYKRTAFALKEREEKLIRLETRTRALLTWGGDAVNIVEFSLNTGRCIGNPDWVLMKDSRKALRKLAREQFPTETVEAAADAVQKAIEESVPYFPSGENITEMPDLAKREPGTIEDMRFVGLQGGLSASASSPADEPEAERAEGAG